MTSLTPRFPHLLHGGDYNPDQWLDCPDILEKDIQLMKEAHINCVSLAIFAWARLEPQEGVYQLDWLEEIIQRLYENGIYTVLATPITTATPPLCTGRGCGPSTRFWPNALPSTPG